MEATGSVAITATTQSVNVAVMTILTTTITILIVITILKTLLSRRATAVDTNLYKMSKVMWAVTSAKTDEPQVFENVDRAADYLESIGVKDEQIDLALIDMIVKGNCRANFGALHGNFIFSDTARLNDPMGAA
jgi:hypothetical protein